jgi:hypothetical protein
VLDFFNDVTSKRNVSCDFKNYFPSEFTACFSLSDWLSGRHQRAKASDFRAKSRDIPEDYRAALNSAVTACEEADE